MENQTPRIPKKSSRFFSYVFIISISALISSVVTFIIVSNENGIISPLGKTISGIFEEEKPLEKYSFENLANSNILPGQILLEREIESTSSYVSHQFAISVEGQKVTGQINLPNSTPPAGGFPIILMNRGFIDPEMYQTGMGTKNAAAYYADQGFITIAPDYLGFGESDLEDADPMAARVKKPMTPLTILFSLDSLNQFTQANIDKVGMWGHSNGGQISLSVLEIVGNSPYWNQPIPTVLWAPVTAAFPYNILHYTDDFDTVGKALRKVLYNFELKYDTDKYSIHPYLDWIESPIQLHQGTEDDLTPTAWSDRITKVLKDKDKEITYYKYPGADHNLKPNWNEVVARDAVFYKSNLE